MEFHDFLYIYLNSEIRRDPLYSNFSKSQTFWKFSWITAVEEGEERWVREKENESMKHSSENINSGLI